LGTATPTELESAVAVALRDGSLTPEAAIAELRKDAAAHLIPSAMLMRLGLFEAIESDAVRVAPPEVDADAALESRAPNRDAPAGAANPRSAETQLRIVGEPASSAAADPQDDHTRFRGTAAESTAPVETPLATGQLLGGRYLLERKLGEGGLGIVYLARDEQILGEIFAVKLLKPEIRKHPEAVELMREEVRKTRALQHPNIVGVYSLNGEGRNVYILMEYLEGKTLKDLIDDDFGRGMPFDRAWPIIQDVCAALAYAHDHSVIHCDLKPSNVFVTTSGKAKLLDFGIARAARGRAGRFDPSALSAMTVGYASCEMLEGRDPNQRDDVYSLGCVVYEMLSGHPPFDRPSAVEARNDHLRVMPVKMLTRRQNTSLAQALAYDRTKRTDSVESLLSGLKPNALRLPRSAAWVGTAATLLLSLAGLAWFLSDGRHKAAADSLSHVAALAERARSVGVDPDDPFLQQGMQRLRTVQQRLAAAPDVPRLLAEAETAIQHALRTGNRLARLGSQPSEIAQAVFLCRQAGGDCKDTDFSDEVPRTVALKPFELDATEVTNGAFGEFVAAKSYRTAAERAGKVYAVNYSTKSLTSRDGESWKSYRDSLAPLGVDSSKYPVRGIDYKSASDYCGWRNQRLPVEGEWEFVARGSDHRIFAWGNEPRVSLADTRTGVKAAAEQPMTGFFGVRGLGDGLLEWVDGGTPTSRVLRGASWLDTNPVNERLSRRREIDPNWSFQDTGFRCARSVVAWPDAVAPST